MVKSNLLEKRINHGQKIKRKKILNLSPTNPNLAPGVRIPVFAGITILRIVCNLNAAKRDEGVS